ncbi:MAG: hypothetical protein J0M12_04785 [Deltaproteobacteria bacterium]|nr:hypothetical protein [Deltaproteobacteria bacterium]
MQRFFSTAAARAVLCGIAVAAFSTQAQAIDATSRLKAPRKIVKPVAPKASPTFDCCLEVGLIPELLDPKNPDLGWACDTGSLTAEELKKFNDCREHYYDPVLAAIAGIALK